MKKSRWLLTMMIFPFFFSCGNHTEIQRVYEDRYKLMAMFENIRSYGYTPMRGQLVGLTSYKYVSTDSIMPYKYNNYDFNRFHDTLRIKDISIGFTPDDVIGISPDTVGYERLILDYMESFMGIMPYYRMRMAFNYKIPRYKPTYPEIKFRTFNGYILIYWPMLDGEMKERYFDLGEGWYVRKDRYTHIGSILWRLFRIPTVNVKKITG